MADDTPTMNGYRDNARRIASAREHQHAKARLETIIRAQYNQGLLIDAAPGTPIEQEIAGIYVSLGYERQTRPVDRCGPHVFYTRDVDGGIDVLMDWSPVSSVWTEPSLYRFGSDTFGLWHEEILTSHVAPSETEETRRACMKNYHLKESLSTALASSIAGFWPLGFPATMITLFAEDFFLGRSYPLETVLTVIPLCITAVYKIISSDEAAARTRELATIGAKRLAIGKKALLLAAEPTPEERVRFRRYRVEAQDAKRHENPDVVELEATADQRAEGKKRRA